jgi:hypothetical protein
MGKRIVFEYLVLIHEDSANWLQAKELLKSFGAENISQPTGQPPYIVTAILPDEANLEEMLVQLRNIEHVGRADEDTWRTTF